MPGTIQLDGESGKNFCMLHEYTLWDACGQGWAVHCPALVCLIWKLTFYWQCI